MTIYKFENVDQVNSLTHEQVLEIADLIVEGSDAIQISPPGKDEIEKIFMEHKRKAQDIDNKFEEIAFALRDRVRAIAGETDDEDTLDDAVAEFMQELIGEMIAPDDNLTYTSYDGWSDKHPDCYWIPSTC